MKAGDRPFERIASYAEARALYWLDYFELIDEETDEHRLDRFGVRLKRDISREIRDRLHEEDER